MINAGTINNPYQPKAGTICPWPNIATPAGWLVCDGSAVSRTTYKALFAEIGETYGAGDGTTTFNLPNGTIPLGWTLPTFTGADSNYPYSGYPDALHWKTTDGVNLVGTNYTYPLYITTRDTDNTFGNTTYVANTGTATKDYLYISNLYSDLTKSETKTKTIIKY